MREFVQQAPGRYLRRQENRKAGGARKGGAGLAWQLLDARRELKAHIRPDRIHHRLGPSVGDESAVMRCDDPIFPGVDAAALSVTRTSQLRSPLPSPVMGLLRFTRSPAINPAR